ncbi:hypothetical protein G6F68_014689 [Rhizopus microsporus]|nr:hypothetical protein G6F68_014689 [Rhizopus microsporus]
MTAWAQTPCGSLPQDNELIAARIGMPLDQFQAAKPRLLRGWWLADDGRLYHDTLAERVLEMIERRDGERNRKAEYRDRKKAELAEAERNKGGNGPVCPLVFLICPTGQARDFQGIPVVVTLPEPV